jgi:hypothetical protein
MTDEDPERLASQTSDDPNLRSLRTLIEEGRNEVPSEEQLSGLAAKLGPVLGGGGGGSGGGSGLSHPPHAAAAASATGAGVAKVVGVVVLVAATGGTLWQVLAASHGDAPIRAIPTADPGRTPAQPGSAAPPEPAPVSDLPMGIPTVLPVPAASFPRPTLAHPIPTTSSGQPTAAAQNELQLLKKAAEAMRDNPKLALSLCDQAAHAYPDGILAQERESLAIRALVALGRVDEARARADAFRAKYPASAHLRRIDQILSEH